MKQSPRTYVDPGNPWNKHLSCRLLLMLAIVVPSLGAFWFVQHFGRDFPIADEFDGVLPVIFAAKQGTLTFQQLAAQHSDHRIIIPRLISLANAYLTGWNRKGEMYFNVLLLNIAVLFAYLIVRRIRSGPRHVVWFVPIAWLLLGWHQWENFVMGMQTQFGLASSMGLLAILCLQRVSESRLALLGGVIAILIATYSFGNGILLWPIGFLQILAQALGESDRRRYRWPLATWSLVGAALCALFLYGYHPAATEWPRGIIYLASRPWAAIQYYWMCTAVPLVDLAPTGVANGLLLTVFMVIGVARLYLLGHKVVAIAAPFLAMILWSAASAMLITTSRLGLGLEFALSSRYGSITMFGIIGLYGLFVYVLYQHGSLDRFASHALFGIVVAGVLTTQIHGGRVAEQITHHRNQGASALRIYPYGSDEMLGRLHPNLSTVKKWAPVLKRYHYSLFAQDPFVSPQRDLGVSDSCSIDDVNGRQTRLVTVNGVNERVVSIGGWAFDATSEAAAKAAFIVLDDSILIPLELENKREDVAREFKHREYLYSGYRTYLRTTALSAGVHNLSVRIVSLRGEGYWRCAPDRGVKAIQIDLGSGDGGALSVPGDVARIDGVIGFIDEVSGLDKPFEREDLHVPASTNLRVSGWAVDGLAKQSAAGVEVVIDRRPYTAQYGLARRDVEAAYRTPAYRNSGFDFSIPAGKFATGAHTLSMRVLSRDGKTYWQTPDLTVIIR